MTAEERWKEKNQRIIRADQEVEWAVSNSAAKTQSISEDAKKGHMIHTYHQKFPEEVRDLS